MPQYAFGSGSLWGVRTDVANSTPQLFGALQEGSIDFQANTKELHGQYQFPVAVARGTGKITGKAKAAQIQAGIMADLFFGVTATTGQNLIANKESGTVPSTPYQITVANGANWVDDLGVIDALTGITMKLVASAPATGQYSVGAGGVYTFAAADTGKSVLISYSYSSSSAGKKIVIANQLLGVQPVFAAHLQVLYNGQQAVFKLHQCISSKLTLATKLEDFVIPEFDFSAFADASGNLATISTAE